jgi:MtN3 and saliva related transmembrane protein
MAAIDLLGLVAMCLTTSSFMPQVWRIWKTRDVSAISLPTYVIITVGLALWLVYGLLRANMPLVVANIGDGGAHWCHHGNENSF